MVVNSPEPTLVSVILWFVWFYALFDEYVASLDFFIFVILVFFVMFVIFVTFVIVIVITFIVVGNTHLGTDRHVVIYLGAPVCLGDRMSGQGQSVLGGVSGC